MSAPVPIGWTAFGVPPVNNGFDERQKALATDRLEDLPPITVYKTFVFDKNAQGTWTITDPETNQVFMTISNTASAKGVFKGPKTMVIYSGSLNDAQNITGTLGDKYAGYSSSDDEKADGKNATQAQQPGEKIGTVRSHEVFSLSSDVILNSHSFKMEREFYSTMGLGKLEWKSDMNGVMQKHYDNMAAGGGNVNDRAPGGDGLRSLLMLQCTYGERERVGNMVMRVRKDERPESYVGDAGPVADSSTKGDSRQDKWRNTWNITKGDFQICENGLNEGQLQEIVASAVIEIERRGRLHVSPVGGGGTVAGKVGVSLLTAIGLT